MNEEEIKFKMEIGKAKRILRGFREKDCYIKTPLYYAIPYTLNYMEQLQKRIDKAIEYIKLFGNDFKYDDKDNLLKILEGKEI